MTARWIFHTVTVVVAGVLAAVALMSGQVEFAFIALGIISTQAASIGVHETKRRRQSAGS